jgi:hypothetical protein
MIFLICRCRRGASDQAAVGRGASDLAAWRLAIRSRPRKPLGSATEHDDGVRVGTVVRH